MTKLYIIYPIEGFTELDTRILLCDQVSFRTIAKRYSQASKMNEQA
ncbi:MAG TPA: hypothetical protein VI037_06365 [Nitrososphaera sp.]|jgi:hypothetical protein